MKKISLRLILGVSLTMLSLAGCDLGQSALTNTNNSTAPVNDINENNGSRGGAANVNAAVTNEIAYTTTVQPITDPGVTWLAVPEKLDDLGLFINTEGDEITYYKTADLEDGGRIIYVTKTTLGTAVLRFREDAAGQYYVLAQHSDEWLVSNPVDVFPDSVQIDDTTRYAALSYSDSLTLNNLELDQDWPPFEYNEFFDTTEYPDQGTIAYPTTGTIEKFADTAYGSIYESIEPIETETSNGTIELKKYILVLADTSTVIYKDNKNFLADDGTLIATVQSDSTGFSDRNFLTGMVANGCGFPNNGDQTITDMSADRLTEIGTTPSGDPLYTLANPDDPLLQVAYDGYNIGWDDNAVSFDDFVAQQPIVLWQDGVGAYLGFLDKTFSANVECGKPVVYLYPTKPTNVTVQVGADMTKSEPAYGNGWSVFAQPNGQLTTTDGQLWNSLYWEGKGHGAYPVIDRGRVVERANIEAELRHDLVALGLNAQESNDFLAFWLPRMPNTKYVRLTWLGTREMDTLAPLTISPKPDSVIRVFLDFSGQDSPDTNLQPQHLGAPARAGFTVVEWGGVLVGAQ